MGRQLRLHGCKKLIMLNFLSILNYKAHSMQKGF